MLNEEFLSTWREKVKEQEHENPDHAHQLLHSFDAKLRFPQPPHH